MIPESLFDLALAADELLIGGLRMIILKTVAKLIRGQSIENIRKTFDIKNDFTDAEDEQVKKENEWCEEK